MIVCRVKTSWATTEGKPSWRRIPQGIYRKHALNTMCYFLHVSPLLNNEQEPRVQIDRVPHSAVSVLAMTSSVAALHLQLTGGVQHEVTRLFRMRRRLLFVEKWRDWSYIITVRKPNIDRLCGLVVRVSGYRYRGLGFDSRCYQIVLVAVGLERGALSLVSLVRSIEELLE